MNALADWALFALPVAIALLARHLGALSTGGAVAASISGLIALRAGWSWATLLVAFFVSSTLLGRVKQSTRERRLAGRIGKGGRRDAVQVLANGGVFTAAALGSVMAPHPLWPVLGVAALATSTADTWATEIGTLANRPPRSIVTWRSVDAGTSGGVTLSGSMAGLAGAAFIGVVVTLAGWPPRSFVAAAVGGVVGCVADSLLGALLQVRRWCATCRMATEMNVHSCGTRTSVAGGQRWLNNDGVNALSSMIGAIAGAGAMLLG